MNRLHRNYKKNNNNNISNDCQLYYCHLITRLSMLSPIIFSPVLQEVIITVFIHDKRNEHRGTQHKYSVLTGSQVFVLWEYYFWHLGKVNVVFKKHFWKHHLLYVISVFTQAYVSIVHWNISMSIFTLIHSWHYNMVKMSNFIWICSLIDSSWCDLLVLVVWQVCYWKSPSQLDDILPSKNVWLTIKKK